MLPKPTLVIGSTLLLALVSGAAAALGLGGMRTQSALNQPFYAEIELNGVRPDEIDAIKARLASREEFSKAGAERPHFLTRLTFNSAIGTDGQPYIQVSSQEPIREPYIDFLVEVLWPQGRLVKEFTVLLDPPARGGSAPPRVVAPRTSVPQRRLPPQPEPAPPLRSQAQSPQQRPQQPAQTAPLPRPAPAPVPPQALGTRFPLYYGPVPSGATLTRIARELTPPGATMEQTAMALFRNNQDAFTRGNINRLNVGVDLVVPTAEELFALDQAAARRQFQDALAGRSVNTSPITDVPSDAQLRIAGGAAPGDMAQPSAVPIPPVADPALRNDLLLMQETTESTRQETSELRSRISELENQLLDIQRLLQLRNEQLAQLQGSARAGDVPGALPVPPAPVQPDPATSTARQPELLLPPTQDSATADQGMAPIDTDRAPAQPIVEPGIGMVGPDGRVEELLPGPSGAEAAPSPTDAASAAESDAPEAAGSEAQPFWSAALGSVSGVVRAVPPWALGAAVGVLGLGGLGLLAYRRRKLDAEADVFELDDALLDELAPAESGSVAATEADFEAGSTTAEALDLDTLPDLDSEVAPHSLVSSVDDRDAIDVETGLPLNVVSNMPQSQQETQEADVIAEADIYILYGRYREAEALLREELERAPERRDLKYKLGEALIGTGNREALAALLEDMRAVGDDGRDPAKWASLESGLAGLGGGDADDGGQIPAAPPPRAIPLRDAPRPVGANQTLGDGLVDSADTFEDSEDTDLGFSVREVTPSSAERLRDQMADLELDLQEMDDFGTNLQSTQTTDNPLPETLRSEALSGLEAIEDPRQDDAPTATPPPSAPPRTAPGLDGQPGGDRLDLDLDALAQLTAAPAEPIVDDLTMPVPDELPVLGEETTNFGLPAQETRTAIEDPLASTTAARVPTDADDDGAAGGPLVDSISSDVLSSQWRMDSGLWDEAATKMDLARAYIEMEDPDAARAILEEVVHEGSEEQRADAAAMLAKIG
jgi:pilus assembly protein FimV